MKMTIKMCAQSLINHLNKKVKLKMKSKEFIQKFLNDREHF